MNIFLKIIDILIHIFFITGFLYAGYQVFSTGKMGVLFKKVEFFDKDILKIRRLYALEFWLIFIGYIIYLGLHQQIWNYILGI